MTTPPSRHIYSLSFFAHVLMPEYGMKLCKSENMKKEQTSYLSQQGGHPTPWGYIF